jgi:hypothetical protein
MHPEALGGGVEGFDRAVENRTCDYLNTLGETALGEMREVYVQLEAGNLDAVAELAERMAAAMDDVPGAPQTPEVTSRELEATHRVDMEQPLDKALPVRVNETSHASEIMAIQQQELATRWQLDGESSEKHTTATVTADEIEVAEVATDKPTAMTAFDITIQPAEPEVVAGSAQFEAKPATLVEVVVAHAEQSQTEMPTLEQPIKDVPVNESAIEKAGDGEDIKEMVSKTPIAVGIPVTALEVINVEETPVAQEQRPIAEIKAGTGEPVSADILEPIAAEIESAPHEEVIISEAPLDDSAEKAADIPIARTTVGIEEWLPAEDDGHEVIETQAALITLLKVETDTNTERGPVPDFMAFAETFMGEKPDDEEPITIEAIQERVAAEQPLEETLVELAELLSQLDAPELEELRNLVKEIEAILPAGFKEAEPITAEHVTTELTEKILNLLRQIGYDDPREVLISFVKAYGFVFLFQALDYVCHANHGAVGKELLFKTAAAADPDDTAVPQRESIFNLGFLMMCLRKSQKA